MKSIMIRICALSVLFFATGCNVDLDGGEGGTSFSFDSFPLDQRLALEKTELVSIKSPVPEFSDSDFSVSSSDEAVAVISTAPRPGVAPDQEAENVYFNLRGVAEGSAKITVTYEGVTPQTLEFNVDVVPSVKQSFDSSTNTLVVGSFIWAISRHLDSEDKELLGAIEQEELDLGGVVMTQSGANQLKVEGKSAGTFTLPIPGNEQEIKVLEVSAVEDISLTLISNNNGSMLTTEEEAAEVNLAVDTQEYIVVSLKAGEWFSLPYFTTVEGEAPLFSFEVAEGSTDVCRLVNGDEQFVELFRDLRWMLEPVKAGSCKLNLRFGEIAKELSFKVQ